MGQKYAAYNAQGAITGFYDSVDSPVPPGVNAIAITNAQWLAAIGGGYTVVSGALVAPATPSAAQLLAQAQAAQIAALSATCQGAIVAGFSSSALGSAYAYPSTLQDQMNQNTVAGGSMGGSLWCEMGGAWAMKAHTQAQAQAVVANFAAWLNACQQQLVSLTAQVNGAATVAAAQAISWANPA
jgi:hypothetical protein